jgi:hypothetical protein
MEMWKVNLVEQISSSCCNLAFKTPEYGVRMKSFSLFIILSTRKISKFHSLYVYTVVGLMYRYYCDCTLPLF